MNGGVLKVEGGEGKGEEAEEVVLVEDGDETEGTEGGEVGERGDRHGEVGHVEGEGEVKGCQVGHRRRPGTIERGTGQRGIGVALKGGRSGMGSKATARRPGKEVQQRGIEEETKSGKEGVGNVSDEGEGTEEEEGEERRGGRVGEVGNE